jgi:hypothetical protein
MTAKERKGGRFSPFANHVTGGREDGLHGYMIGLCRDSQLPPDIVYLHAVYDIHVYGI